MMSSCDIIPECDRQTDRQTDMPPIAYTPLAKLALPCAVIKIVSKSSRVNINRNKNNTHIDQVSLELQLAYKLLRLFGNFREFFMEISGNISKSLKVITSIIFIRIR